MGSILRLLVSYFVALLFVFHAPRCDAAVGDCGQPVGADVATATDALFVLRTSVGLVACNRCTCDVDDSGSITASDALNVLRDAVGLPVASDCPACDPDGLTCPGVVQFALFAKIRGACATNDECAGFSVCDPSLGRCRTASENDIGWTGLSHNADTDDPVPARLFLDCVGPAPCGHCTIAGHDPSLHNCRCLDDNRQACFTVAGPDDEFCGGGQCVCYFGPPLPVSAGNTPTCVLNSLASQPSGEVDVDRGAGTIQIHFAEKVFLGLSLTQPCPLCVNDTTPADGVRDGSCAGGLNNGQDCDAQAYNSTFPPPTGALYSLDCFPVAGANITGPGLSIPIDLTTGRSELHAEVPCATDGPASELSCPCRVCSGDETRPCNRDADCAAAGAGTCSSNGVGAEALPNDCTTGQCDDVGGEQGVCAAGPGGSYCDLILRADGTGLISCATNDDCASENIGVDGGNCTRVEGRPCFLDPIVAQGFAHPLVPLAAGTFCSPPTLSETVNSVVGLPGPGRLTLQTAVSLFCKSDPHVHYAPGNGGCP